MANENNLSQKPMLVIDDQYLLNALLRLLWSVKFDMPPEESEEFASSPLIAEIYQQTYEAMIKVSRKNLNEDVAHSLEKNRPIVQGNFEINSVKAHIKYCDAWNKWNREQQKEYIEILFKPFIANDEIITEIINFGNDFHQLS